VSKYLKGSASEWLDGEPTDSDVSRKVLGAYDRAAYREPRRDKVREMLERIERIRGELTDLEKLASTANLDGFALFNEADKHLFGAELDLKSRCPEASGKRPTGKPVNLGVRIALERAIGLGRSWKFTAALLFETGRLDGDWARVYDQVRKTFKRMPASDDKDEKTGDIVRTH
jgi:hypothetical protein